MIVPEIDILMATYNGEKYIAEQIDSILAQTFQDFKLIIRDDGSSDNTPAIIEDYAHRYPAKIEVVHDNVVCRNAARNFFQLLKYAETEYVMFSDQDDYWLPYKIQITLDYVKQAERENPGSPVLAFTGLKVVDEHLKSMDIFDSLEVPSYRYEFGQLLLINCVLGCTELMNRALYEKLGDYEDDAYYHDSYAALCASAFGVMVHVPMALILYRQHSNNNIGHFGAGGGRKSLFSICRGYIARLKKFPVFYRRAILFRKRFSQYLSPQKLELLDKFIAILGMNRPARFLCLIAGRYPVKGSLAFRIKFIIKCILC